MKFDTTKEYPRVTDSKSIIRFQDCDPLGHLNNAKYFDYFFNAREDQIAKIYGVSPVEFFLKYKTGWVAYQQQIAYLSSALPGSWVRIFSSQIFYDENTRVIEYYMTNEAGEKLMAVLWTTLKYIDSKTTKVIPHQAEVMEYLKAIHFEGANYPEVDFNQRIKDLKTSLKKNKI